MCITFKGKITECDNEECWIKKLRKCAIQAENSNKEQLSKEITKRERYDN
jgi:hypothetical protein